MKFHIVSGNKNGPWGGGNQFLKALKKELTFLNLYSDILKNSDIVIFNSYQDLIHLIKCFLLFNNKKRFHRLGPIMSLHRSGLRWKIIDRLVIFCANLFADLVVFQSLWSYEKSRKLGFWGKKKYIIIGNAIDTSIFWKKQFTPKQNNEKIKLIYISWSSNMKKGFEYIKFLDEYLDFSKYNFTFIGNSPFQFKNIKMIKPLDSEKLAEELRNHDIFISPTKDDACSNALLEALATGLPVLALASGGNPEIVRKAGVLFKNKDELLAGVNIVASNLKKYYDQINVRTIRDIAKDYIQASQNI